MSKTGQELVAYGKSKLGMPYFYGAKIHEGALTENKMKIMNIMYPKVVTDSYLEKARLKGQVGKVNTDCSGLIAGYREIHIGSSQLYQTAYTRMPIADVLDFAKGVVLWRTGHVGVYAGVIDGVPMVYEARGINYGTILSKVSASKWTYGLTFSDMIYTYDKKVDGTWKGSNPYKKPTQTITSKAQAKKMKIKIFQHKGEEVKWIQWELIESGYPIKIDGICGPKTVSAIVAFQASCKIKADGLAGKQTWVYLETMVYK